MANDDHDSLVFRAMTCRVLVSPERNAIGIEGINASGQSLVLELAGDGPKALRAEIERIFRKYSEMADWKSPGLN